MNQASAGRRGIKLAATTLIIAITFFAAPATAQDGIEIPLLPVGGGPLDDLLPVDGDLLEVPFTNTIALTGETPVEAAIALSQATYESAANVLLTRDDLFADAMSSGSAQGVLDAPLLVTDRDVLDPRVIHEIDRLVLSALPDPGAVLADTGQSRERRAQAAWRLSQALGQLGSKPPPAEVESILLGVSTLPGPESSVDKLYYSELDRRHQEIAQEILGPYGQLSDLPSELSLRGESQEGLDGSWWYNFLWSRAGVIYAGSSQIQKNIIGERVLGLPPEPRPPQ